jgi:hypothetical protein
MPKRLSKTPRRPSDFNSLAAQIVSEATGQPIPGKAERQTETVPPMSVAEAGRKGGLASAEARKTKIPPEQRKEIARRAAQARWYGSARD